MDTLSFEHRWPTATLRAMEKAFRADFAAVRLFESALPSGIAAMAGGEAIVFDHGYYDPSSPRGLGLLAHELAHVLQQRTWRAPRQSRRGLLLDPLLEAAADRAAADALASAGLSALGRRDVMRRVPVSAMTLHVAPTLFQPYVKMARRRWLHRSEHFPRPDSWTVIEAHYELLTDFNAAAAKVRGLATLEGAALPGEIARALEILKQWMGISIGGTVFTRPGEILRAFSRDAAALARIAIGRRAELKMFNNYRELTTALLGEVRSEPSALFEAALARAVLRTPWIAAQLRSLANRIVNYWDGVYRLLHGGVSLATWAFGYSGGEPWMFRGSYWQYHHYTTPLSGLKKANGNRIDVNIAVLHDMVEFIKQKTRADEHLHRMLQWMDPHTGNVIDIPKREMRNNLGTVNENFAVVREGRQLRYSMQAGPSYTVGQMMALADAADAPINERTALAYAIFAFWNQVYQRGCTPIHTYYEVMVAAAHFGVPFNANNSFRANAPAAVRPILDDLWVRRLDRPLE